MNWMHGPGDEAADRLIETKLAEIGLVADVESASYGEGTSCGGYLPMDYSFMIAVRNPQNASPEYLGRTSKRVVDVLFASFHRTIESFRIAYVFEDREISCAWGYNHGNPEQTDASHTCVFQRG
jgi:hypothetical protein